LGTFIFIVLSLVKVAESEGTSISVRENYLTLTLTLFLFISVGSVSFYQNDEVQITVEDNNKKLDKLLERTKEKEIKIEDVKVFQNVSGVIQNEDGDKINEVKIYIEKTKEEIKSNHNGEYIFKNIFGNKNEKTKLIISKPGCDTRNVSIHLGQKRDIVLSCIN